MSKEKCACNGKDCDGICRETNLNRKRSAKYAITFPHLKGRCPAMYGGQKAKT